MAKKGWVIDATAVSNLVNTFTTEKGHETRRTSSKNFEGMQPVASRREILQRRVLPCPRKTSREHAHLGRRGASKPCPSYVSHIRIAASRPENGVVHVWQRETGQLIRVLEGHGADMKVNAVV